jgi:hypothetical protein
MNMLKPEVSRTLTISLKQARWDEAEELVGGQIGALEKLVAQLLKEHLQTHHRVNTAIHFNLPVPREDD